MQKFKIQDETLEKACADLKTANATLAEAKKRADNAKAVIESRLAELRGIKLDSLSIGELVSVEGVLLLEIGKQTRFDEASFQVTHAELYQNFRKEFATKKFKVLS